ncbi:MAG: ketoacyl-ACP synthase III [Planctomycetes bacterium]|nr:ketoacyl-ACP synthase III [Planctomycetota bacterium]
MTTPPTQSPNGSRRVGIAGLGRYVPERRLTNADLEKIVDTSDEWIVQRTGIRERRIAAPGEDTSGMALRAARQALEDARINPEELDLVICATVTGDQPFPATSCRLGKDLGATRAGGFDLGAACSGFVFGSQVAASFIQSGACQKVLVVGAEILSRILDYTDRNTCVLFGDGAGAAVFTTLERAGRGEFLGGSMGMDGGSEDILAQPGGGSRFPATHETVEKRLHYMKMGGTKVFKFAVRVFAQMVQNVLDRYGRDDIGVIIPHQVNQRIIESAMETVGLPMDMVFSNIDRYGNTSAASVPIAMREALEAGRLVPGKLAVMPAFGAGMAWGHLLVRW